METSRKRTNKQKLKLITWLIIVTIILYDTIKNRDISELLELLKLFIL